MVKEIREFLGIRCYKKWIFLLKANITLCYFFKNENLFGIISFWRKSQFVKISIRRRKNAFSSITSSWYESFNSRDFRYELKTYQRAIFQTVHKITKSDNQ